MPYPAPTKQQTSATIPYKKIKTGGIALEGMQRYSNTIVHILHLPGGQRIITYSYSSSFRVWDLETGVQVGEAWEDIKGAAYVEAIALSPDGKIVASGSQDGTVRLWNIDTGKVIKKWTEQTKLRIVRSVYWSSDGGRIAIGSENALTDLESGSNDATFRVWDIENGATTLGPIKAGESVCAVCYSPDARMIATAGIGLKIWNADTGELLTTLNYFSFGCLAWTSDAKTLIAGGNNIRTFDTATWTEIAVLRKPVNGFVHSISLSPDERILASTSFNNKTAQLWNLETNQLIGTLLHHEGPVKCAAFSADGMFLMTGCNGMDAPVYTWDVSATVKEASILSNNVDVIRRPAPKIKGARRIPPGFFGDARHADLSSSRTQSHGQHNRRTPPPRQRTFSSFWRRHSDRRGETEHDTQSWSSPSSWTRNLVSGVLRRRDSGSDVKLREPPIVEVPCTAGKPRNYHARKKRSTSPSRSSNTRIQQHTTTQDTSSSSQQPPPTATATASILPAVAGAAGTAGTISRPHITITGWPARLMAWVCCVPIQNAD